MLQACLVELQRVIELYVKPRVITSLARCSHLRSVHFQVAVSDALLDRLEDCKRTFHTVAVLGGAGASPQYKCTSLLTILTVFM